MHRITALLLALCCVPANASEPEPVFRFDAEKLRPGTVYHYVKSNIDGSRAGNISVYIASTDEIESFKWHEGGTEASLVRATMDWTSFTVARFESWRLRSSGEDTLRAVLERIDGEPTLEAQVGDQRFRIPIENWPWHSYDFDFASLNLVFRFLVDPDAAFTIGIADLDRETGRFVDKGPVRIERAGNEARQGTDCRVYRIDGEGLENRGGKIWVSRDTHLIVDYEIDLPDEPGFTDGKLTLIDVETMSPSRWAEFKTAGVGK